MLHRLITLTILLYLNVSYASEPTELGEAVLELRKFYNAQSIQKQEEYKLLVQKNQERVKKEKSDYETLIEKANKAQMVHSNGMYSHEDSLVGQIIQNHQNQEIESSEDKEKGLLIFVSFSMPRELLWSYFEQANLYGGRLIIRGLVENSFKKTIEAMQLDDERKIILDINPKLFELFKINQVPAIVLSDGLKSDKLLGSISIKQVLEEIGVKGDLLQLAQERLLEVVG